MQLINKKTPNAGFEEGDTVSYQPDDHQWSDAELSDRFEIKTGVYLSDEDYRLLGQQDIALTDTHAVGQLPAFQSVSTGEEFATVLRQRKYHYTNNAVELKPEMQEE